MKKQVIEEVDGDAVDALLSVEKALKATLINRSTQIRALMLAITARQNIMLEGPPGTAKTMLGSMFSSFVRGNDFRFFKTQMMKGSVPEQIFGPLNIRKMRENAVWEYNTEDMLPSAHIAILEEVYRSPEMLLSSMLSVLNERIFHNGHTVQQCPLICAIGTTNFVTEGEEIEAFKDRWLIHCKIDQLKSPDDRMAMFNLQLNRDETVEHTADITLTQIKALHEMRREVKLSNDLLQLYEQLCSDLAKRGGSVPITDRRLCATLSLVQANAVLNNRSEATEEDLIAAEYGLIVKGDTKDESLFATAYQFTIGNYQLIKEENAQLAVLDKKYHSYLAAFDPSMGAERARKLQSFCQTMLNAMNSRTGTWVSNVNKSRFDSIYQATDQLMRDATEVANK